MIRIHIQAEDGSTGTSLNETLATFCLTSQPSVSGLFIYVQGLPELSSVRSVKVDSIESSF